jgi:Ca2+-binding RTX toxin-like protein
MAGVERIGSACGDAGNDTLQGGANADTLSGGSSNDGIQGGNGNKVMFENSGNDFIVGGINNDIPYGGSGKDFMSGGKGKEIFVFNTKPSSKTNLDTIQDFTVKYDKIYLENGICKALGRNSAIAKPGKSTRGCFPWEMPPTTGMTTSSTARRPACCDMTMTATANVRPLP